MVHRAALALALVVLLAGACGGPPGRPSETNPYPPLAALKADPAVDLLMPGATLLGKGGHEGFMNITGWQAAFYGGRYGTQESADAVFAFYARELPRLGWTATHKPILSTVELHGWGWCKPWLSYDLTVLDPKEYPPEGQQYRTLYQTRLQGSWVKETCPSAALAPPRGA